MKETIEEIVAEMREGVVADGWMEQTLREFADRVLAAHKREMADEKRISDAVVQSLRDKKLEMAGEIVEKEAEISSLRALVKEMADELSKFHAWKDACALVAKAREVIGGAE